MAEDKKPRLVGINHVAIEVDDIDAALDWYGQIFDFTLRGRGERNAFIDIGDQFINLTRVPAVRQTGEERGRRSGATATVVRSVVISALSSTTALR